MSKQVDAATAIPGGTGNFTSLHSPTFSAIPAHPSVGGGDVVFFGRGSAGQQGVYAMHGSGPPIKLADLNTAIPDGTGNFTAFFPQLGATAAKPRCWPPAAGGQQGIYRVLST